MFKHTTLLLALLGLTALLIACPKSADDSAATGVTGSQAPAQNPCDMQPDPGDAEAGNEMLPPDAVDTGANPCGEQAVQPEGTIKQPVENMAEAMRDYYGAGFRACFHPESPSLEAQVEKYNAWKKLNQNIEIAKLEIVEQADGIAVLDYEFVYTQRPENTEVKREGGSIEVIRNDEGNWLIMDIIQN